MLHEIQLASWQRCRVHLTRNLLAHIPKRDKALAAAALRTVFVMADRDDANQQLAGVAETLQRRYPKAADLLGRPRSVTEEEKEGTLVN